MRSSLTVVATMFCVLLSACGQKEQAQQPNKALEHIKQDEALTADPDRAEPELERRLAASVSVDGGLLLVRALTFLYVMPVSTPWTLQCSVGMSIVFGNSITGDNSETENDVTVNLALGSISQDNCGVLAPRIGKRLLAILGGH